jgi:methylthioribose-1-phosphate isomerase
MPMQDNKIKYLEGWNVPYTIWWDNDTNVVKMIDQSLLPEKVVVIECQDWIDMEEAIKSMKIRGAPAIGIAGAYALALEAQRFEGNEKGFFKKMKRIQKIAKTRPTAVNLEKGVKQVLNVLESYKELEVDELKKKALEEAERLRKDDIQKNQLIGKYGSEVLEKQKPKDGKTIKILTHCNAGSLATGGYGTALGVVRSVVRKEIDVHIFVDETRPLLQGARITAWEMIEDEIPVTLITDDSAGWIMKKENIDDVIVGADRIALNGDTANKIGTYSLSILAREHGIPFYVAAPMSTIDDKARNGGRIEIEKRSFEEVTYIRGVRIAPYLSGSQVRNYAFDITPHKYITGIITDLGIMSKPYKENIGLKVDMEKRREENRRQARLNQVMHQESTEGQ